MGSDAEHRSLVLGRTRNIKAKKDDCLYPLVVDLSARNKGCSV
jgi:hypothetical protein